MDAQGNSRRAAPGRAFGLLGALWFISMAAIAQPATPSAADAGQAGFLQVELEGHAGAVRRLAVDDRRDLVVTGADDKTARLWTLSTGKLQRVLRPPVGHADAGRVYGVALHPKRPWVAIGGNRFGSETAPTGTGHFILVYDSRSGEPIRRIDTPAADVKRLVWSPDGSLLVAGFAGRGGLRAFDTEGKQVFVDEFGDSVYGVAVAPGLMAAASLDGSLRVYTQSYDGKGQHYAAKTRRDLPAQPASLAFSPSGTLLAIGYVLPGKGPDVVDWANGRITAGPTPTRLGRDTLLSVAWSPDGRFVYAAGSYPFERRNARLVVFEPGDRTGAEIETGAPSTITDLLTLPGGRLAFASANGSWGTLDIGAGRGTLTPPELPDLDGARNLLASEEGSTLSWALDGGRDRVTFDLATRLIRSGDAGPGLNPPLLRRSMLDAPSDWENHRNPQVNGVRIPMAADEMSRATALFATGGDALLGTSQALYRLGPGGTPVWRKAMHTEVRAVNISRGGKLICVAMLDGTVRLLRATDGEELLTVLMLRDRRWIVWSPDGYYDASVGADRLVGWVFNRQSGTAADYFPAARLRERFHRPRYIDLLLQTLDRQLAAREQEREIAADGTTAAPLAAPVRVAQMPPTLRSPVRSIDLPDAPAETEVEVQIALVVRAQADSGPIRYEARVDGRRENVVAVEAARGPDGDRSVQLRLHVPASATALYLAARDGNGYSERLDLELRPGRTVETKAAAPALAAEPSPIALSPSEATPLCGDNPTAASRAPNSAGLKRLFVLAIGAGRARNREPLQFASKDATDFVSVIRLQEGRLYENVIAGCLLDAHATASNVRSALAWLAHAGTKHDNFIVFLAGHGQTRSDGSYLFTTADGGDGGPALDDTALREALNQLPGHVVLFVDTCRASRVLGPAGRYDSGFVRFIEQVGERSLAVFAASSGAPPAQENTALGNGAFTSAILTGLRGAADLLNERSITYKGFDLYMSRKVPALTGKTQTPVSRLPPFMPDNVLAKL